jgi:hypothetical protein
MERFVVAAILALVATSAAPAQTADGLVVKIGRVYVQSDYANAVISVENRTDKAFKTIKVSCGFYSGDHLLGSGFTFIENLQPGSVGHETVLARGAIDARTADCRVELARQ